MFLKVTEKRPKLSINNFLHKKKKKKKKRKRPEDWQKRFSTTKDIKKELQQGGQEGQRHSIVRSDTPWVGDPQMGGISQPKKSSPRSQVLGPYQAPQPRGLAPGRQAPRTSGFENQRDLYLEGLEGYRKQTLHS